MYTVQHERRAEPPSRPFIIMNPRSGGGKVQSFDLREKAEKLGATVLLLDDREPNLAGLLRDAIAGGADLLGVAGGDGTIGLVAGAAADSDLPLLVIPAGTRNHFALDLGLDVARPDKTLDALTDALEVDIDLGSAGARPFVNTVSFGAYAEVVERPMYREHKLLVALDALPEVLADRGQFHFTVHGGSRAVRDPIVALISNNPYRIRKVSGTGHRPRLDSGTLGLMCVERAPRDPPGKVVRERSLHAPATVTTAPDITVAAPHPIPVAIDGESTLADMPMRCRLRHNALRVRVPRRGARR